MRYKYFKCSVELSDEYQSIGFILKANKKDPIEKIKRFFDKHKKLIRYDGVYLPLTECSTYKELDRTNLNLICRETLFGLLIVR